MNKLTQQFASSEQTNAINNLKDKTQGLSYDNEVVGLTGKAGGFLAGKKKAMSWDAQGNLIIDGKVNFSGADLQTTLDGKQPKGDYVMTPAFNTYKQNTVEIFKKLQPKGDYALRDELTKESRVLKGDIGKVSDSLSGYQRKGDYAVASELSKYQRKGDYALASELSKLQPKGNYASVDALSTFQPKGNYVDKSVFDNEFKKFAQSTDSRFVSNDELKKFAQTTDSRFVSNPELNTQLKKYALLDELKKYVSADELKKYVTADSLKNFASLDELKKYAPVSELQKFASLDELKKFALADELKKYALLTDVTKYVSIDELKKYATIDSLKDLSSLKASVDAISKINLQELSAKINSQDLSKYALKSDLSGLQQSNIFSKPDGFDRPAIQLGATNDAKDTNIYSLSFGKAEGGTYTGMGLVPNDKKAFPNTTGPILGTHIKAQNEFGIFSDGWDKLFAVQGGSGNVKVKGTLDASGLTIGGKPVGSGSAGNAPLADKAFYLRSQGDTFHGLAYGAAGEGAKWGIDGPVLWGNANGALAAGGLNGPVALTWDKNKNVNVAGTLDAGRGYFKGGVSVHNPEKWNTHFSWQDDNKNYIRGDTELRGNLNNIGDLNVGKNAKMGKLQLGDKWTLSGVGDVHGNDDWLRVFNKDGTNYHGGVAMNKLWVGSADATIAGRNVLGEIDELKKRPTGTGTFNGAMSDKQLRLRGPDDGNHYIGFTPAVDGVRVQGHQGGQLGTNIGGDKTALSWNADGDINIARNTTIGDNLILGGDNSWILHTPDDGRKQLYIAPRTADKKDWDWGKQTQFMADGSVVIPPTGLRVSNPDDWMRIVGSDKHGVALYNGLSVNDNGGVNVGQWGRVPQGEIKTSGQVCIGPRWCIVPEGDALVFRDRANPKVDRRYAMFPDRYVDLADPINNGQAITIRSDKNGKEQRRLQRSDDELGRFANNNRGDWEKLFIEKL